MKALVILCFLLLHGELEGHEDGLVQRRGQDSCPPGVPLVKCFVDPCWVATCPLYPTAICRSNFCGGCNAEFFLKVECNCAATQ